MPKLRLEKWYSTENRHEEHFFLVDGLAAGYQESAYCFGYNPEMISPEKVKRILAIIEEPDAEPDGGLP
jgi:hypothetical protein